ncbi:MAG: hypothetical protein ACOC2E_07995 [Bacteroidota bacterium]
MDYSYNQFPETFSKNLITYITNSIAGEKRKIRKAAKRCTHILEDKIVPDDFIAKSIKSTKEALEKSSLPVYDLMLGIFKAEIEQFNEAIEYLEKVKEKEKSIQNELDYLISLIRVYSLKKTDRLEEDAKILLGNLPEETNPASVLYSFSQVTKDPELLDSLYHYMSEKKSDDPRLLDFKGWLLTERKEHEKALEVYKELASRLEQPEHEDLQYLLAGVYHHIAASILELENPDYNEVIAACNKGLEYDGMVGAEIYFKPQLLRVRANTLIELGKSQEDRKEEFFTKAREDINEIESMFQGDAQVKEWADSVRKEME